MQKTRMHLTKAKLGTGNGKSKTILSCTSPMQACGALADRNPVVFLEKCMPPHTQYFGDDSLSVQAHEAFSSSASNRPPVLGLVVLKIPAEAGGLKG